MSDVHQQRRWASTEVRAYVLTDNDVNVLRQQHLPLWLQRRILDGGASAPVPFDASVVDATAEPYQYMDGCDRVSVDVGITANVRLFRSGIVFCVGWAISACRSPKLLHPEPLMASAQTLHFSSFRGGK